MGCAAAAVVDVSLNAVVGVIGIFASLANVRGSMLQTEFGSPEAGWREPGTPFHRYWRALIDTGTSRRYLIGGCPPGE
jgi:hypothetical protein